MTLRLEQSWTPDGAEHGTLRLRIHNIGTETIEAGVLGWSATTRPGPDAVVRGGTLLRSFGTHGEIALDAPIAPRSVHEVDVTGLTHPPKNRTQGVMAAWVERADGTALPMEVGDLAAPEGTPRGPVKDWPEGRVDLPLCLIPWPATVAVEGWGEAPALVPADAAAAAAFATVAALHRRLFPADPAPLALGGTGVAVSAEPDAAVAPGGYRLTFGPAITLAHSDPDGLRHGTIALAQIAHAARGDSRFAFPLLGTIEDAPRFGWRGCHFDVSRNFHGPGVVCRLIDILAWLRMNRLHWHLTDDEGWRLPSRAFPDLMTTGATRARGAPLPPLYADGPDGQTGVYSEADIAGILARADSLGVAVMPEIDMPGHMTAVLAAVPGLRDADEPDDSYRSIQGFPNNALNPALPRTYEVVETLLAEAADMFPGAILNVGGDEVDAHSWHASPAATALAEAEGLEGAHEIEAHFLRRVQGFVHGLGRTMGAWDEAADGGGVSPENTILFAWRTREKTADLIAAGYDVVATPGQAYYLDMIEGAGWDGAGTCWAGEASPETTYRFEPSAGLPEGPGRLLGVQAGIWSEHLNSVARLNAMAFPRLAAVAEAGWTDPRAKDWDRFCALSRLVPRL